MKKFWKRLSVGVPVLMASAVTMWGSTVYAVPADYLCPESNSRYMTESDIKSFSLQELNYAKNEIYARRGYLFNSQELKDYFNLFDWYKGTTTGDRFSDDVLNAYECANIELLRSAEYALAPEGYPLDQYGYNIYAVGNGLNSSSGNVSGNGSGTGNTTTGNSNNTENNGGQNSASKLDDMKNGQIVELGKNGRIDLNADGEKETVKLTQKVSETTGKNYYTLTINDKSSQSYGMNVKENLYGVCLGSNEVYLIVAMDGASDDPECHFYRWQDNEVFYVGSIKADVNNLKTDGYGVISAPQRTEVLDSNTMLGKWEIGYDGYLHLTDDGMFELTRKDYKLKKTIQVYEFCDYDSRSRSIDPQNVRIEYTNGDNWIYIAETNGNRWGWFESGKLSLDEKMQTFGGLSWAD